jgi:hypothetical protein
MRLILLTFLAAATAQAQTGLTREAQWTQLLDRTVWIDIGLGRSLKTLTPKQIADLRKCREPTMALQKSGGVWIQSFYAGIEMRTTYSSANVKTRPAGTTVLFYTSAHPEPAETLRIAPGGEMLVEQTRGFRPHTFLKCSPPKAPAKQHTRR